MEHIGYKELGQKLQMALDICGQYEKKLVMTGRDTGATGKEFGDYIMSTLYDSQLEKRWEAYTKA